MSAQPGKAPSPGDRVECGCAPACERAWPGKHGPCIRGIVLVPDADAPDNDDDGNPLVLVRQDHGGYEYLVDIGYGQSARRSFAPEVWCSSKGLRVVR